MKIVLDSDKLTVPQLYALSWMLFDQHEVYMMIVQEHNERDAQERAQARAQFIEHNPEAFND